MFVTVPWVFPHLRDGTIVPDVSFVREQIGNIVELSLLHVLLNWIKGSFGTISILAFN